MRAHGKNTKEAPRFSHSASTESVRITASPHNSGEQCLLVELRQGGFRSRLPDGQAECDLVHEVSKVVHQVESAVIYTAQQISEEVAERVNRPANSDNEAHGVERGLHVLVHFFAAGSHRARLTHENLKQDE